MSKVLRVKVKGKTEGGNLRSPVENRFEEGKSEEERSVEVL